MNNDFYKNILVLVRGTTIAQFVPLILTPILTRIYSPEDFGVFAIYIALMSMLAIISTGKYELAIILPKNEKESVQLFWLTCFLTILSSLLIALSVYIFENDVLEFMGLKDSFEFITYLLPITVFVVGINQASTTMLNRLKLYNHMSNTKIIANLSSCGTQIYLSGILGGLLFGHLLGQVMSGLYLYKGLLSKSILKRKPNIREMWRLALDYRIFPQVNAISSLLNTSSVQLIPILLTSFFSTKVTGYFSLAQRILQMPMLLLGSSVAQVYFQKANELTEKKNELRSLTLNVNRNLLRIGIVPICTVLLFGEGLFIYIFGEEWKVAGQYASYLSPWIYLVFISSPLSHLLIVLNKQKEQLYFNIVLFFFRVGWLVFAYFLSISDRDTILVLGFMSFSIWLAFVYYVMSLAGVNKNQTTKQLSPYMIVMLFSVIIGSVI